MKNDELIKKVLSLKESQVIEVKRAAKRPADVLPVICAFANADGGIFVYGLADKEKTKDGKRLIGLSEAPDHADELLRLIGKEFDPPVPGISHNYLDFEDDKGRKDKLLCVSVDSSHEVHSLRSGQTYTRKGRQNVLLTHREARQLEYEKGSSSFESEICTTANLDDLDEALLKQFLEFNDSREKDVFKFLAGNGLAVKQKEKYYLTNAAVLLFGKNPTVTMRRKVGITIISYYGVKRVPSGRPNLEKEPFTIEGSLITQINTAYDAVLEKASPVRLKGATFKRVKIPPFAIQEAIANAVIHRDYSIQNHIHIRIFDNRIEVESPGWFAGLVTPETILNDRFARNPIIERTLRKMPEPPNLDIGEGVDRMFHEMDKRNLYLPIYLPREYTPHSVQLVLLNEERTTYWDMVQKYLADKGRITNKEFRAISGLGTLEASDMLKKWVAQALLEKRGASKKGTYYQKPGYKPKQVDLLE